MWLRWLKGGTRTKGGPDDRGVTEPAVEQSEQPASVPAAIRPTPPSQLFTRHGVERAWLAIKKAGGGGGVDGVTIAQFARNLDQELQQLQEQLTTGAYRPRAVRRILVPKPNGGLRPLALWALRDRVAQRVVYDIIAPVFEATFLPCSFGFRPGIGTADAVAALVQHRDRNLRWVVNADVKECFEAIDRRRLQHLVGRRVQDRLLRRYIAGWLDARILNGIDGALACAGASQGNVLSPLLANIYMHEVDRLLMQRQLAYLRYADDFVIVAQRKADAEAALVTARQAFARWGLTINADKTRVGHFDQGVRWLGYFLVRNECYRP